MNVPPPLVLAVLLHREAQETDKEKAADLWCDDDWIFTQATGKPLDPRADYGEWKGLLKDSGVREARLHDARHTAATFLLVLGVEGRAVMDVMGWSKISMTQRYQHVSDDARRGIADKLSGLLWRGADDDDGQDGAVPQPA